MATMVRLESGRWYGHLETDARGREFVHYTRADRPEDTMRVALPFAWRSLPQEELEALAHTPEIRIWNDEHGIRWRIAAVGPGTSFDFPIPGRFLVFDSEQAWAGITRYDEGRELGDLTDEELAALRTRVSDLGGSRRSFRPPPAATETEGRP
jgi:hypothetical protein